MKPEYQQIVDSYCAEHGNYQALRVTVENVAARCEALANKPVLQLTDEEIDAAYGEKMSVGGLSAIRRVIVAHIAKQSEEIPFDQKKLDEGGWEVKLHYKDGFNGGESIVTKVTLVRKQ